MDMSEVKAFNAELSGLYDNKPPISKAKMSAITRGAIKAIKFYKHVVHSVEKFIQKCKPEYKVPGLYVIDSIVRQSRHQFGQDKDVFAPRFAKNMQQTFANLFRCPPEDKRNIIRVLNLWQKNNVFTPQVIQPLLDMADPNHPLHQEIQQQQQNNTANGSSLNISHNMSDNKISPVPPPLHTPQSSTPCGDQFQDEPSGPPAKFNRKLLNDFEYESEDEVANEPPSHSTHSHQHSNQPTQQNPADALGSILTNPEIMRQLQSLQAQMQMMTGMQIPNLMPMMSDLQMQQNQSQNLPFLSSQEGQKQNEQKDERTERDESDIEFVETGPQVIEIPDANDSSPSPRARRVRSRSKSPRRRRRSRSRSPRRRRDRDRDREKDRDRDKDREKGYKEREADREKQREREKKGLPPIKKENLSVCSTTLWVGHLSKLATPEELSDLFGAIGGVSSIDVVAPRGCAFVVMERRRDAAKAIQKLNKHKLHSKEITVAWAPGRGVKGREWKDHWEAERGVAYLPWAALQARWALGALSLDALEDGGAVDEDTLPPWLPPRILPKSVMDNMSMLGMAGAGGLLPGMAPPLSLGATLPGAMSLAPSLPPTQPPAITMAVPRMPPPGMPAGMPPGMAPGMPPGIRPPSMPAGVPGLPGAAGLPGSGALLRFPPAMQPQSMPQPGMVGGFLGELRGLLGVGALVGGVPLLPPALPPVAHVAHVTHHQQRAGEVSQADDAMELDTEEHSEDTAAEPEAPPALLPDQIQALLSKPPPNFNASEPPPNFNMSEPPPFNVNQPPPTEENKDDDRKDRDRERRDRERDRDRRSDRDRDRRDRDSRDRRERGSGRERDGRDRERDDRRDRDRGDRDRRDRRDRDRDRDRERDTGRYNNRENREERSREKSPRASNDSGEKSLQERLWEMANGKPPDIKGDEFDIERKDDAEANAAGPAAAGGPNPANWPGPPPPQFRGDMRMRGPSRPMSGPWMDGPGGPGGPGPGPFGPGGPRFNGMGPPPFNRPPFDGPRPPFDGPRPPFDGPRFDGGPRFERPPFGRMPFDGPMNRPPFDGPRPPFDGPRPPFDGPMNRPPFDGPRPPFDGPRPPFDGPRAYDGPYDDERPPFDRPRPPFDGPPEYFDGRQRRFDDREQFPERGAWGDQRRDRRHAPDDRYRDRRRPHGDDRPPARDDRSRSRDDRSQPRDDRNQHRDDRNQPRDEKNQQRDERNQPRDERNQPRDERNQPRDEKSQPRDERHAKDEKPKEDKPSRREERRDRKSRWGAAEETADVPETAQKIDSEGSQTEAPMETGEETTRNNETSDIPDDSAREQSIAEATESAAPENTQYETEIQTNDSNIEDNTTESYDAAETKTDNYEPPEFNTNNETYKPEESVLEKIEYEHKEREEQNHSVQEECSEPMAMDEPIADLYDAGEAVDTSFSKPAPEDDTQPEKEIVKESVEEPRIETDIFTNEKESSQSEETEKPESTECEKSESKDAA